VLGHARGIALLAAAESKRPIAEYTPAQVKMAVTGSGRADKEQVQHMVRALLKLPEVACEDASDALAVAICHCHSAALQKAIGRTRNPEPGTRKSNPGPRFPVPGSAKP
jgi:crossover junction endodeoxyribonuclease RuvC